MRVLRFLLRWSFLLLVPAGAAWALSPLGVYLSEYAFRTPNVFWRLFPSAPILMLLGLAGVFFFVMREKGIFAKVGFWTVVLGGFLTVVGTFGKYYLGLDDVYIMTAPAYAVMRAGFVVLAAGAVVFGAGAARERSLPFWGALPFAIAAVAGLVSVARDFGEVGAAMWISFGVGWSWLGLALLIERVAGCLKKRRADEAEHSASSKTPATSI
ncbi:MAG: hypothetical protein H0U65_10185 [Rubrobacter sp.]|nr:hypothetical protein [Rubrobacter sp.]